MTFFKRFLTFLAVPVVCCGIICFSVPAYAADPAAPTVDVQPFFLSMPQLPDGYFDGDILANGDNYQLSLDFSNLSSSYSGTSSESGTIESDGMDRYTITVPAVSTDINGSGSWDQDGGYWYYSPIGDGTADIMPGSSPGPYGSINSGSLTADTPSYNITASQSAAGDDSYTGSSSESGSTDYSGTVSGNLNSSPDYSQHYRFRCFSIVYGTLYRWVVTDARNVISSQIVRQDNGYLTYSYSITSPSGFNFPVYSLWFTFSGSFSGQSVSRGGGCSWNPSSSSGGIWLSPSAPFPSSVPSFNSGEYVFRDAVFGKETLLFQFLNTIHSDLNTIHSDLTSFQSAMTSAISNQTSTLVNTNSPGNFDQTSMGNTGSLESLESSMLAPSTDTIFSSDSSSFTSGMGFWRDRMNDLLYFNGSPILPLTVFSLTLGLAAMIIGRRVSGGGSA